MSFKALHSAMLDQVEDVIHEIRARVSPHTYVFKDPDRPAHQPLPEDEKEGYPAEMYPSLLQIAPDPARPWRITELHWWPELDRLCVLHRRWKRYHEDVV